ncbi:MAG: hypothetical protein ABI426_01295 [Flavobacterium sp.]
MMTLGFFLLPAFAYACGTQSEKGCCKKEIAAKSEKKDCCKKNQSKDKNNGCGGKCGHSNCTTSPMNFSLISSFKIEFNNNTFDSSIEKPQFYHSKTFISSGFTSVWLPPKIK